MNFEDKYEPPVLVGEGSFGKVYRLKEKKGSGFAALKVMDKKEVWEKEKTILSCADHPLFPKFIEAGEEDGKYYILMEYIFGENLADVLERRKGFAQAEAMRMALTVADGIGWLQTKDEPVIFRDLKAENIVLTPEGEVRLVDFGSACGLYDGDRAVTGTRGCSAPEQFEGKAGLSSDVYAFGRLFHFMITGINPASKGGEDKFLPLQQFDGGLSYSLELLIEDCTIEDAAERLPDMYCVTERMVKIASCSPREYKKMEKEALLAIKNREQRGVTYEKNIRR
ncbi:MAG: serine/threonine protein kinase [Lachnospiraceae bacterium]|nr:serine/threonine protein kinase [Lachnospiraceae bacterium]